jgi:hypothetical protein
LLILLFGCSKQHEFSMIAFFKLVPFGLVPFSICAFWQTVKLLNSQIFFSRVANLSHGWGKKQN